MEMLCGCMTHGHGCVELCGPFRGQPHLGGAPVITAHLAFDQTARLKLAQRARGCGAVDTDEIRDVGGVFLAFFGNGDQHAPFHTGHAETAQIPLDPAFDDARRAGNVVADAIMQAEFLSCTVNRDDAL